MYVISRQSRAEQETGALKSCEQGGAMTDVEQATLRRQPMWDVTLRQYYISINESLYLQ